jgi:uncharacterized protein (TIGR02453 family)
MIMKEKKPVFSKKTLEFLLKASRQRNPDWLNKQEADYQEVLVKPLKNLASHLQQELGRLAPSYHFPLKGIGRLKRPVHRVEKGGPLYKDWIAYSASRPSASRFENNPNLFFLIQPKDRKDSVLVAGGLYHPSSRQVRAIREAIAQNPEPFETLFQSKEFKKQFPKGFSDERISSRVPRGFDPDHPRMDWIKLQGFFVWKPYSLKEFSSRDFPSIVARDWKQVLRLNELLEAAIGGQSGRSRQKGILDRLEEIGAPRPLADF